MPLDDLVYAGENVSHKDVGIGWDIGTTRSVVAVFFNNRVVCLSSDADGGPTIPSWVLQTNEDTSKSSSFVVGTAARAQLHTKVHDPSCFVQRMKTLRGISYVQVLR